MKWDRSCFTLASTIADSTDILFMLATVRAAEGRKSKTYKDICFEPDEGSDYCRREHRQSAMFMTAVNLCNLWQQCRRLSELDQ